MANDYRRFNFEAYAYRTTNYGKSWTRIVDKDDVESYALCIIEHSEENNLMFLGTDDGLYVSINAGDDWVKYTNGFPTVSVKDLAIQERENDLVIGTFGRAAWVLDDLAPFVAFAKAQPQQPIALYQPPTAYFARYQQPTGSRFGADAMFHGENRGSGAKFKYFFDKELKAKSDTVKSDSIYLKIYDDERLIRTLSSKTPKEKGIHTWSWRMREKGADRPSRNINTSKREPSGVQVLPGTYRAVLEYGNTKSETSITIKEDPRIDELSMTDMKSKYEAQKRLEALSITVSGITEQLSENKKKAQTFLKLMKDKDKKAYKDQIKRTDSIIKGIELEQNKYFGTPDKRQGITRNPEVTVMNRVGLANQYISSRQGPQTATETQLFNQARELANERIIESQTWLTENWDPFVKEMKDITIDLWD